MVTRPRGGIARPYGIYIGDRAAERGFTTAVHDVCGPGAHHPVVDTDGRRGQCRKHVSTGRAGVIELSGPHDLVGPPVEASDGPCLWLVQIADRAAKRTWVEAVATSETAAQPAVLRACAQTFGPQWRHDTQIRRRAPHAGAPVCTTLATQPGNGTVVELSGPYELSTSPRAPAANRPRPATSSELRVYLAGVPTLDLLARITEIEEHGPHGADSEDLVKDAAVDVLCGRHPAVDAAVRLWAGTPGPDYTLAEAVHRGLEGLPGVWPCRCCFPAR